MQQVKKLTWLMLPVILLFIGGCTRKAAGKFSVTINYKNLDKMMPGNYRDLQRDSVAVPAAPRIMLEELPYGGEQRPVLLDSAALKGKEGSLVLNGIAKEEGIYEVVIEDGPAVLLVNDVEKITLEIDLSKKENYYTVSGSEGSRQLQEFIAHYDEKASGINTAFRQVDSLKQFSGSDSLLIAATNRKNQAVAGLNDYLKNFIAKTDEPAVSLFVLGMCSRSFQQDEFEKTMNATIKKFPEHKTLAQLKTTYDMRQLQQNNRQPEDMWVGKQAPDLALPSVDGKPVSISSFRGKYLLVDFWASWCGPCRQENPNLVRAYNEFKDKNFTILGISLDKEREPWLKAIKDDKLTWTHISDLAFWNSKAVELFKFDGIPYNILVDPQGKVIAERLRGEDLENKLKEILQ
jgi:peroxiredoxin